MLITPETTEVACEIRKKFQSSVMRPPLHRILFVCMGNICRSPAAEIVFHQMVRKAGREKDFLIDSAGTLGIHQGNPPDHRMRHHLKQRGYEIFGTSRKITADDLELFDLILVMDDDNESEVRALDRSRRFSAKIRRLTDYGTRHQATEVPDPYYGGDAGFVQVIDLIEDACEGLLKSIP
jgi:protein-tyrosine phosphatase